MTSFANMDMDMETLPPGVRGGAPAHRRPRHSTEAEPCAMHRAARRGQLTLTLEWDPDSWTGLLWANHVRVKWWGEPGDGRLLWCASAAYPHRSIRSADSALPPTRTQAHTWRRR